MADLIDSYSESNVDTGINIYSGFIVKGGQAVTVPHFTISSVKFYLKKTGSPTGNAVFKAYSVTGTVGSSAVPNALLATSGNLDVATLTTSYALKELNFASEDISAGGLAIACEYSGGNASNAIVLGYKDAGGHSGNLVFNNGSWIAFSGSDAAFYLYGVVAATGGNIQLLNYYH